MADVFISYSSADRARVGRVARALEQEGLSVWWDRALIPGDRYETEIDAALASAKAVIVVWSQASCVSDWVRSESESARQAGHLVPVLIEPCRVPRPFDRLHTADLRQWKGDRGNDGFPELSEAVKAIIEGRAARPVPWRRRLTLAAIGTALVTTLGVISAVTGIVDAAIRYTSPNAFAERSAESLSAGDASSLETQEGFRRTLEDLARSTDLRTQRALATIERGSREEAIASLRALAEEQGVAIEGQMQRTANLWRQVGLLRFNENPRAAREALEQARRFAPDDVAVLTALAALYQREGRIAEADDAYRAVLAQGALDPSAEGRVRQVIGQAHLERAEADAAEREFGRALTLAQQSADDMLEADLYIDLGLVELDRGAFDAARARFHEARDFAQLFDYAAAVAYADYNTAEALIAEGQFAAAQELLARADAQAEAIDEGYLALFIDIAAARLALRLGESARALDIATDVQNRAREMGVRRAEVEALMQIAEAELRQTRYRQAEASARAAREGWRGLRTDAGMHLALAVATAAASQDPTRINAACANLAAAGPGRGYVARELERISMLGRCPA